MALFGKKKTVTLEEALGKISSLVSTKEFEGLKSKISNLCPEKILYLLKSLSSTHEDLEVK